jgi:hypothetical protein
LYDVIGETVIDHVGHCTRPDHLSDQKVSIRRIRHADALLSEVSKTKGDTFSMTLELNLALESLTTLFWN